MNIEPSDNYNDLLKQYYRLSELHENQTKLLAEFRKRIEELEKMISDLHTSV